MNRTKSSPFLRWHGADSLDLKQHQEDQTKTKPRQKEYRPRPPESRFGCASTLSPHRWYRGLRPGLQRWGCQNPAKPTCFNEKYKNIKNIWASSTGECCPRSSRSGDTWPQKERQTWTPRGRVLGSSPLPYGHLAVRQLPRRTATHDVVSPGHLPPLTSGSGSS